MNRCTKPDKKGTQTALEQLPSCSTLERSSAWAERAPGHELTSLPSLRRVPADLPSCGHRVRHHGRHWIPRQARTYPYQRHSRRRSLGASRDGRDKSVGGRAEGPTWTRRWERRRHHADRLQAEAMLRRSVMHCITRAQEERAADALEGRPACAVRFDSVGRAAGSRSTARALVLLRLRRCFSRL